MSGPVGYVVLHETEYGHGVASSVWPTREPAENQLSYCLGMQAEGRPGSEGRYFVAEVREVSGDSW